jgi:hypothetical protein
MTAADPDTGTGLATLKLREALEAAGVDVPVDARKADLVALFDLLTPPQEIEQGRPSHMTRLEARAWSQR